MFQPAEAISDGNDSHQMGRYIQRIGERAEKFRGPRSREGRGVRFEREGDCFAGGEEWGWSGLLVW